MSDSRCGLSCFLIFIASIVIGAIVALLFAFGLIPGIDIAFIAFLILAALLLLAYIALLALAATGRSRTLSKCLCAFGNCLLAGIIGTIVTAVIPLSIILVPGSLIVAIIVFIAITFISVMIISLIALLNCILSKLCSMRYDDYKN